MTVRIQFREAVPQSDAVRGQCEQAADALRDEFPEATSFDFNVAHDGEQHEVHVHVTGKHLDCASSAKDRDVRDALHEALERTRKQLRKHHDKQICSRRRS